MATDLIRPGVMSRRLVLAGVVLTVVSACGGVTVTSDEERPADPSEATAYSLVDDVETWDLTGEPSDEAFGIPDDSSTGIFETSEPRRVRIVLEGRTVETEADLVDFRRGGQGDYTFRVSTPQRPIQPVTDQFRDALEQLGLDTEPADQLAQQAAGAPPEQPEVVEVGVGERVAVLGRWSVAPSATFPLWPGWAVWWWLA